MNKRKNIVKHLQEQNNKVIELTKTNYILENGDTFEHTFDIDENITIEEFQQLLDNSKQVVCSLLNKTEEMIGDE
jgi:hypothetical protein